MNPNFNCAEFDIIKSQAGLNRFRLSAKEWTEKTNAIGIISKAGRYGGTYAHKDIAFEFAMWISPEFKVYLIREFQRLKDEEQKQLVLPKPLYLFLMLRFVGIKVFDKVCLVSPFLVLPRVCGVKIYTLSDVSSNLSPHTFSPRALPPFPSWSFILKLYSVFCISYLSRVSSADGHI
jgi:hypothetical protein